MIGEATFSDDRLYRYVLTREWLTGEHVVAFIMLNPSTADAQQDDPTIRRCIGFAQDWGFRRLVIGNLFAFRSTDPMELLRVDDPVGPDNDDFLTKIRREAHMTVCAWGNRGGYHGRGDIVKNQTARKRRRAFGLTKTGQPRHPLYLRAQQSLVRF